MSIFRTLIILIISLAIVPFLVAQIPAQTVQPDSLRDSAVNTFLDAWHLSAAEAREDQFFGSMAPGGIYLGTDPSERWTKESFEKWALPHFQKETAWDFKPHNRHLYFSDDGSLCWFEELLDTWMGTCRGSGVLQLIDGQWKIRHYNLAVTVFNEAIHEVIRVNKSSSGNH